MFIYTRGTGDYIYIYIYICFFSIGGSYGGPSRGTRPHHAGISRGLATCGNGDTRTVKGAQLGYYFTLCAKCRHVRKGIVYRIS